MNRALDACHKAGIGLISMKQVAGNVEPRGSRQAAAGAQGKGPEPYQGLLHAIWTDERFSSCCVSMRNTDQVRENAEAAREFKPLTTGRDRSAARRLHRRRPDPLRRLRRPLQPGRRHHGRAGQPDPFLTYHEHHGYRGEARRLYAELTDAARDWTGADLEAARQACPNKLDFAKLLPKADQLLG